MEQPLPHNDRDAMLAQKIGDLLEQRVPLSASALGGEPFHRVLDDYRAAASAQEIEPGEMWAAVAARTQLSDPPSKIFRLRTEYRWIAAAATVLVALGLLWMVMGRGGHPGLVAAAGAEIATYTAGDGSTITLRPHSRLYEVRSTAAERHFILDGEAFFDVALAERVFSVSGQGGRITVIGTRFNVSTWAGKMQVFVDAGRVRFEDERSGDQMLLSPGDWAALRKDSFFTDTEPPARAEILDWLNSELVFAGRPLGIVLAELEHHFNIEIIAPEVVKQERISGRVYLESPEQSLADISMVIEGRFVPEREGRFRYRADD